MRRPDKEADGRARSRLTGRDEQPVQSLREIGEREVPSEADRGEVDIFKFQPVRRRVGSQAKVPVFRIDEARIRHDRVAVVPLPMAAAPLVQRFGRIAITESDIVRAAVV